ATMRTLNTACEKHGATLGFDVYPSGLVAQSTYGNTLPDETLKALPKYAGWILGPVDHASYPPNHADFPNPSGVLRTRFELYANIRPARAFAGVPSFRTDIDLVTVRENTEGFYADRNVLDDNGELRPNKDMVISV